MKWKNHLLLWSIVAAGVFFACKSRVSNVANAQSSGDELKNEINDCGSNVQCVGFVLADAIIALRGGGSGGNSEKVTIEYFGGADCHGGGVLRTQGHDGKNFEGYCASKGNPDTKSIKIGGKCINTISREGCYSFAAEKNFDQDLVEAYYGDDNYCEKLLMVIGDSRGMTISDYCRLKSHGYSNTITGFKIAGGDCQSAHADPQTFCEKYAY